MAEIEASLGKVEGALDWKEPRLLTILFCDFHNISEEGKANLIGIFDRVYVHPETRNTPVFTLFIRSVGTVEEGLKIRIITPEGNPAILIEFAGEQPEPTVKDLPNYIHSITRLQFNARTEGIYSFQVFFKGEILGIGGLVVQFRETEDKQGGTDSYY